MPETLFLVKHALPQIVPDAAPKTWLLGETGEAQAAALAERLRVYQPTSVLTSEEAKAARTGQVVAERLELPYRCAPNLHEHDRTGAPFFSPEDFDKTAAHFFAYPNERVWGNESAEEALTRFEGALEEALGSDNTPVVVAHGTVIALFVGKYGGLEPYPLWKRLECPSFVALSLPDYRLLDILSPAV